MYEAAKKVQTDLRKAKRALKIAESVMSYCQGDRWDRWEHECTAADRAKFNKLYKELTGEEGGA